ncbi:MAG TPA: hypothetical protein VFS43_02105 [Polyangiaceae bacterium]|nr:hypothetical protein [Polyangiaceae bacterium]
MDDRTECVELADLLAQVATGAASGADRARMLRHLNECDECRQELDELSRLADEVLLIAPEREPPAAFESAVLDRIAASTAAPSRGLRHWFTRPALYAAAAAIFGIAGAGTVWQATTEDRELAADYRETLEIANGQYFAAQPLTDAAGAEVGHVFLYDGQPSWVFAVLGPDPAPGAYDLVVTTADGDRTIASCEVETDGCGGGGTVDSRVAAIQEVRLVAANGTSFTADLASARSAE